MPTTTRYVIVKAKRLPGRPRWLVVAVWTVVALAVCAGLTAGVAAAWLQRTTGQVARNDPQEVAAVRPQLAHSRPGKPINILVLGSDRRAGDLSLGARSDTLMVVRLDPQTDSISLLSVPRDLRVEIPGYGLTKINAAYAYGGAALSLRVTKRLLGIPINDFVDIDFDGFKQVVNKLGGAYLMIDRRYYNDTAVTDYASINIQPGYQRLSGAAALSWVRFRHDQSGDFTRIVRQEIFLREMKRQLMTSARLSSLPRFLAVMGIVSHNVTSDISSLGKSYGLLKLALRLDNARVYQTHVYGSAPMIDGIDYVVATRGQVRAAVRRFLHPQWATPRTAAAGVKAGAATTASAPTSAASPSASPSTAASGSKPVVTDSLRHVAEVAGAAAPLRLAPLSAGEPARRRGIRRVSFVHRVDTLGRGQGGGRGGHDAPGRFLGCAGHRLAGGPDPGEPRLDRDGRRAPLLAVLRRRPFAHGRLALRRRGLLGLEHPRRATLEHHDARSGGLVRTRALTGSRPASHPSTPRRASSRVW